MREGDRVCLKARFFKDRRDRPLCGQIVSIRPTEHTTYVEVKWDNVPGIMTYNIVALQKVQKGQKP